MCNSQLTRILAFPYLARTEGRKTMCMKRIAVGLLVVASLAITACDEHKDEQKEAGRPDTPHLLKAKDVLPPVTATITITLPQQTCVQTSSDGNNNYPVLSASGQTTISWVGKVTQGVQTYPADAIEVEFPPTMAAGLYKLGTPLRIAGFAPAYTISSAGTGGPSTQPLAPADTAYGNFNLGYVEITYQNQVYPCKSASTYGVHVQQ